MGVEKDILTSYKVVAVVGLSPDEARPSHGVAHYLKENGFKIIPVNPTAREILGETCYPDLASIPELVEIVDIFRRSEDVASIVEEAIRIGAKVIWMQEGVENEEAASRARKAGCQVVMDRCMKKEHMRLAYGF